MILSKVIEDIHSVKHCSNNLQMYCL